MKITISWDELRLDVSLRIVITGKFLIDQILWILENMDIIELHFIPFHYDMSYLKFPIVLQNRFEAS